MFKNSYKQGNEKRPDYRGHCQIGGIGYWMDGWINESQAAMKYMSVRFRKKASDPPDLGSRRDACAEDGGSERREEDKPLDADDIPF